MKWGHDVFKTSNFYSVAIRTRHYFLTTFIPRLSGLGFKINSPKKAFAKVQTKKKLFAFKDPTTKLQSL